MWQPVKHDFQLLDIAQEIITYLSALEFHEKLISVISFTLKISEIALRYDLTDTAGVLENKVLSMYHGLDDYSVLVEGFWQCLAYRKVCIIYEAVETAPST